MKKKVTTLALSIIGVAAILIGSVKYASAGTYYFDNYTFKLNTTTTNCTSSRRLVKTTYSDHETMQSQYWGPYWNGTGFSYKWVNGIKWDFAVKDGVNLDVEQNTNTSTCEIKYDGKTIGSVDGKAHLTTMPELQDAVDFVATGGIPPT